MSLIGQNASSKLFAAENNSKRNETATMRRRRRGDGKSTAATHTIAMWVTPETHFTIHHRRHRIQINNPLTSSTHLLFDETDCGCQLEDTSTRFHSLFSDKPNHHHQTKAHIQILTKPCSLLHICAIQYVVSCIRLSIDDSFNYAIQS